MERKQLAEKLELMKKELERKQKKLEKAKRAARVKAHVKQKIKELNHQAKTEHSTSSQCTPVDKANNLTDNAPSYRSPVKPDATQSTSPYDLMKTSASDGTKRSMDTAKPTEASGVTGHESALENVKRDDTSSNPLVKTTDAETEACVTVRQNAGGVSEVDDSLAITPSFKSVADSGLMCTSPTALGRLTDLNLYENSEFTLNLHTEASICGNGMSHELRNDTDSVTLVSKKAGHTSGGTHGAVTVNKSQDQIKRFDFEQPSVETEEVLEYVPDPRQNYAFDHDPGVSSDQVEKCNMTCTTDEHQTVTGKTSESTVAKEDTGCHTGTLPSSKTNTALLKLQDIGCAEVASPESSQQSTSSQSQTQSHHEKEHFLDYTELDAIPFSQFELTEDFLSELSQTSSTSSAIRGRRKTMSALVQRRSPRLSGFEFDSGDKLASESATLRRRSLQESSMFMLARKQKRTKKALLLSSLFQFLVDEAKRDPSFVEFKLPDDIANLTSRSKKNRDTGEQTADSDTASSTPTEHYVTNSLDTEVIPETEIDPDLVSQRLCAEDLGSGTQKETLMEEQLEPASEFETNRSSEVGLLKEDFAKPHQRHSYEHDVLEHNAKIRSPSAGSEHATESKASNLNTPPSHAEAGETLPNACCETALVDTCIYSRSGSHSQTNSFQQKTQNSKGKRALKLRGKRSSAEQDGTNKPRPASDMLKGNKQEETVQSKDPMLASVCSESEGDIRTRTTTGSPQIQDIAGFQARPPATPRTPQSVVNAEICSSPVLFGTQSQSSKADAAGEDFVNKHCGCGEENGNLENNAARPRPVFTPSKSKDSDQDLTGSCSWIRYSGCAESGCREAVVDTVVGTVTTDDEETAFILSVQTTALTLWTLDDHKEWSAEFHWYLPQTSEAQGACRISSCDEQLAVLVWGVSTVSQSPFLTVFVYAWDTQHTQRFNVPLPSSVTPHRLFCLGLPSSPNTVLVLATDKVYTKGKKYVIDWYQNAVTAELAMEEVEAQLVDLRLINDLPDAVLGLTEDQRLLVWNHKKGALIMSMSLPDTIPKMSRIFSSHSLQGYLLVHAAEMEPSGELCLVALNPAKGSGKVVRKFKVRYEQHGHWNKVVLYKDLLLLVNREGLLHVWDPCSTKHLVSFHNCPGKIITADMLDSKDSCWLMTGQESGCLHVYSVTQ